MDSQHKLCLICKTDISFVACLKSGSEKDNFNEFIRVMISETFRDIITLENSHSALIYRVLSLINPCWFKLWFECLRGYETFLYNQSQASWLTLYIHHQGKLIDGQWDQKIHCSYYAKESWMQTSLGWYGWRRWATAKWYQLIGNILFNETSCKRIWAPYVDSFSAKHYMSQ